MDNSLTKEVLKFEETSACQLPQTVNHRELNNNDNNNFGIHPNSSTKDNGTPTCSLQNETPKLKIFSKEMIGSKFTGENHSDLENSITITPPIPWGNEIDLHQHRTETGKPKQQREKLQQTKNGLTWPDEEYEKMKNERNQLQHEVERHMRQREKDLLRTEIDELKEILKKMKDAKKFGETSPFPSLSKTCNVLDEQQNVTVISHDHNKDDRSFGTHLNSSNGTEALSCLDEMPSEETFEVIGSKENVEAAEMGSKEDIEAGLVNIEQAQGLHTNWKHVVSAIGGLFTLLTALITLFWHFGFVIISCQIYHAACQLYRTFRSVFRTYRTVRALRSIIQHIALEINDLMRTGFWPFIKTKTNDILTKVRETYRNTRKVCGKRLQWAKRYFIKDSKGILPT